MEMVNVYSFLGATIDWHCILVRSCPMRSSHSLFLHLKLANFFLTYWSAVVSGLGCCLGDFWLEKPAETLGPSFMTFMMYFVRYISGLHSFKMSNPEVTDYRNSLGLPQDLTVGPMTPWPVLFFLGFCMAQHLQSMPMLLQIYKCFRRLAANLYGMKGP